jgi:putative membrane-bound dehydrogenase-like protein
MVIYERLRRRDSWPDRISSPPSGSGTRGGLPTQTARKAVGDAVYIAPMRSRRGFVLLMLALLSMPTRPAGQRVDDRFVLPDDLEIALWAESPMFYNPTNIDTDWRGRIWVAEAVNYRSFNTAKGDPLAHPAGDRIVILSDTDGDGRADDTKVFVQDADLRAPLGLAVIGNRVIVSASPHVVVFTDANGDDKPDKKEILLSGFGGFDHDHGLHALVAGPDGRWFFNTGNAGPHIVSDKSGWTLRAGSLYTGGTPYNLKNRGGMTSDGGQVWTGGLALRMEPDGTQLRVLAHNFRNAYELAVDSFGDLWQNDNDDQVMTCRMTWLMEGANAGYFSADGTRFWQADRRPGQSTFSAHWHQDDPGVLPAGDNTGAGAPAGVARYESELLGSAHRGMLLSADAGRNVVFGFRPTPRGAGFALERFELLSSLPAPAPNYIWNQVDRDRRKWFRPSDVAVGPDGAIYVADWFDPIVGGHQMHDRQGHGRIYRITPKGRTLTTPAVDLTATTGQVQALLSPAVNVRAEGFARLKAQGVAARPAVKAVLDDTNPFHRARAIWLLAELGPDGIRDVERLIDDRDPQIRLTAFRALRKVKPSIVADARQLSGDPSPAVRREVALALRDVPFAQSHDILVDLAMRHDGTDRWYLEALGTAAAGNEEALYTSLRSRLSQGDPLKWTAPFASIAWRLHPAAAIEAFSARAGSASLTAEARQQALVALGFIDDPRAAQAMADLTRSPLRDVGAQAAWWLTYRKSNDWHRYPVTGWTTDAPEPRPSTLGGMLTHRTLVLDDAAPIDRRIEAALAMANDPTGAHLLIELAAQNKIVYQLREAIGSVIFGNPDRSVRSAAMGFFARPGGPPRMTAADAAARPGDATRGAARFLAACSTCHRRAPDSPGVSVGPDLTDIDRKFDRAGLADAIVNPSAGIAFGFAAELFVMRRGEPVIGFLQSEGATIAIRDGYGRARTVAAGDLGARVPLKSSLMPDPLALGLTEQDVADIVAFLMAPPRLP